MLCSSFCHFAIYHHSFFAVFFINLSGPPSLSLAHLLQLDAITTAQGQTLSAAAAAVSAAAVSAVVQIAVHRTHKLAPSLLSISSIGRRRKLVNVQCISFCFSLLLLRLCCLSTVEQQQQKSHLKGIILITTTILITLIITPNIISSPCPCSSTRGPPPR